LRGLQSWGDFASVSFYRAEDIYVLFGRRVAGLGQQAMGSAPPLLPLSAPEISSSIACSGASFAVPGKFTWGLPNSCYLSFSCRLQAAARCRVGSRSGRRRMDGRCACRPVAQGSQFRQSLGSNQDGACGGIFIQGRTVFAPQRQPVLGPPADQPPPQMLRGGVDAGERDGDDDDDEGEAGDPMPPAPTIPRMMAESRTSSARDISGKRPMVVRSESRLAIADSEGRNCRIVVLTK
jgi:hypothetical protein